jgi:hypothetical protein
MRKHPGRRTFRPAVAADRGDADMKITLKTLKPRNPLVAAARFRRAGMHGAGGRLSRQQARHALRRELTQMKQHSP